MILHRNGNQNLDAKSTMEKYKKAMSAGVYQYFTFDRVDNAGNLSVLDNGVLVQMNVDALTGQPYDLHFKSQLVVVVYAGIKGTGLLR